MHLKKLPTRGKLVRAGPGRKRRHHRYRRRLRRSPSRSNRTITPASSSRSRARPPASAASCATSSPWARARSPCWIRCASAVLDDPRRPDATQPPHPRWRRLAASRTTATASACPRSAASASSKPCYRRQSAGQRLRARRLPQGRIFYAKAAGVGNPVIYVGAKTGRDGIHGASHGLRRIHRGIASRSGPTCRWAIRSWKSCCSKPASKP